MKNIEQFEIPHEAIRLVQSQASSDINKFLKHTLGNNLLQFFDSSKSTPRQNETIAGNFAKINKIIDEIQNHLQHRFQNYQKDLLAVVKQEIEEMNIQTKRLISELQQKIEQKQGNTELWFLRNETDFFKSEALKLFEINKNLRIQIKLLKKTIKDYEVVFDTNDLALQKLKKKQLRYKLSLKKSLQQNQLEQKNSIDQNRFKINKLKIKQKLHTEATKRVSTEGNSERIVLRHPKSSIKFQNNSIGVDILTDNNSIPSLSYHTEMDDVLSKCQIRKIDSEQEQSSINVKQSRKTIKKQDKTTQTNNFNTNIASQDTYQQELFESGKNINLLKSGFVQNTPNRIRKQSIFRKSMNSQLEIDHNKAAEMNKTLTRNKLVNIEVKPKFERSLFKQNKQ